MKIMIVTPYFYPKVGGLENYALNIAKGLKKDGHEVFVVTSNHESKRRTEEKAQGLYIIRLAPLLKLSNTPINPFWRWQLRRIIKSEKPDVINAHTPVPYISDMAVRVAGRTPTVLTYHNDLVKASGLGKYLAKLYYVLYINRTLRRVDRIIATSQYYAENSPYIAKYKNKTGIVSPGVDTMRFNPQVDKYWLHKKYPKKKIILFVGSMDKTHGHKGVDILIKATAKAKKKIPNIQLVAVSKGDDIPAYKILAKKLGIADRVDFTGFVPDEDLSKYYAGAHVFVLPSTTSAEGFGMVLIEAQASGIPVIGTKVGGIPFAMRHNETGLLIKPESIAELTNALIKILNTRNEFGMNGVRFAKSNFAWEELTKKSAELFRAASRINVCLIHNIVSPYRLPVYEEVNKHVNLTVLFCKPITKDRAWSYDLSKYNFNYKILKGFSIGPVIFNTNVLKELHYLKFDVIMANSDPDIAPSVLLGFVLAKLRSRGVLVWSLVTDENIHFFPSIAYSSKLAHRLTRTVISKLVMLYRKFCFAMANHFLAFTNQAQVFLKKHGVASEKITRTYQIMPPELLPEPNIITKRNGSTFLSVGYLNERKGLNYLIDAFMQIPDDNARLIIAGTGPVERLLKEQAKSDKRIKFVGYIEGVAKANLYTACDIFVLPTLLDVWGLVINEAIYYGLAIICSDAAQAKDLVDRNTGFVFRCKNEKELKDDMVRLMKNQELLKSMQIHNYRTPYVCNTPLAAGKYVEAAYAAVVRK